MNKEKIWLSSPHMSGRELAYVNEAFETNWIAPLGPHVNAFEQELSFFTGMPHAAALSSGTSAIHLAMILLGVERDDLVICQSLTFSASANPIIYQGAHPVFVDSEKETWNMSPEALQEAIELCVKGKLRRRDGSFYPSKLPKAIVPVHLYGMPGKMDEIMNVSSFYGIPLIEDAAEALGSKYDDKPCGSFGELSVLSFNGNKIITTSGGGALLSKDKKLIEKARFLATQARDHAPHYQHSNIGYNYRLSNVLAGIGRGQLEVLNDRVSARRLNHKKYLDFFRGKEGIKIHQEPSSKYFSNYWLTTILVNPELTNGISAEQIRTKLDTFQIESRPLWKPMHLQPIFEREAFVGDQVCEQLFDQGLCLPSGSNLRELDFERIFEALAEILNQ